MSEKPPREGRPDKPAPLAEQRIEGHLIRKLPKESGVAPPHVEFFSETNPDGFPDDQPRFVAFCPDCGTKLTLQQHEDCPFFGGSETDRDGFVIAVHCGLASGQRTGLGPDRKPEKKPEK
jgi:hypothetical protein